MRNRFAIAMLLAGAVARHAVAAPPVAASGQPPTTPAAGPVGDWLGTLTVGAAQLRLGLRVERNENGELSAKLNSIDQNALLPVDTVSFAEETLRLGLTGIGASYTGTLKGDGSAIDGTWTQSGRQLPLTLNRQAEPFALQRPQDPRPPFPYESREVTFLSASVGIHLAGTLVLPPGEGPFPAVVFVTGSGPQDRDESLMGHKPFLVIADALARRGIASLRYDDRGVGASEGNHMESAVRDFAGDVEGGLAFLAAQPRIDRKAIGIVGHSEGGLTAALVASAHPEVAFLVLLAPPGVPLPALLLRQLRDLLAQSGVPEPLVERVAATQEEDLALLGDAALSRDEVWQRLRARAAARRGQFSDAERALLRVDAAAIEAQIGQSVTPWFRSLLREDPAVYLRTLKIPVLALFGDRDLQVAAGVNADAVRQALATAGNAASEVRVLPGLNHLFQHAGTGAIAEYGTIEETFAPEALDLVGGWIDERFGPQHGARLEGPRP